jgi:hypothetical protein
MADMDRQVPRSNLHSAKSRMIHLINRLLQHRASLKAIIASKTHPNRSHSSLSSNQPPFHRLRAIIRPSTLLTSSEMRIRIIMATNTINSKAHKFNRTEHLHLNSARIADTMFLSLIALVHFRRVLRNNLSLGMQQPVKLRQAGIQHPTLQVRISSLF